MLMRIPIFLTLLILLPSATFAGSPVADFLLKAVDDAQTVLVDEQVFQVHFLSLWINEAEFRLNVDADLADKENNNAYEIRLKPKSYGQYSAEKTILELRLAQQENRHEKVLNYALYQRYLLLLALIEKENEVKYFLQSVDLMEQEARFYRSHVQSKDFQADKLLDAELSLEKGKGLADLNTRHLQLIRKKIGFPAEGLMASETISPLVLFLEMKKMMSQSRPLSQSPDILASHLSLRLEKALNQSIKAQHKLWIDLLTFQYKEGRRGDAVGFTIGVNIPLGESFSTSESLSDVREAQSKLRNDLVATEGWIKDQQDQFHLLSAERDFIQNRIQKIEVRIKQPYAMNAPELLFTLKHLKITQMRSLAEINSKAIKIYIDVLNLSGMLGQQPLRNWIQESHPELLGS